MSEKLTGGCLCEKVRYECHEEPKLATYCHCPDCKKTTGSAFCVGVVVNAKALEIISGTVKAYTKTADSGNKITRVFCPECGSPLFTKAEILPNTVWIKAGSLDKPELIKPAHQTWTEKAVKWAYIDDDLPSYPQSGPEVEI